MSACVLFLHDQRSSYHQNTDSVRRVREACLLFLVQAIRTRFRLTLGTFILFRLFAKLLKRTYFLSNNYRVIHCSAKRGLAIACCPSVCLSVTLVDCGWKSWKLIARTISPTPSIFVARRPPLTPSVPGKHGEIWGKLKILYKEDPV